MAYLSLSNTSNFQVLVTESQQASVYLNVSALTLDPSTGELWVSDNITGGIYRCDRIARNCQEVIASSNTGIIIVPYIHIYMYIHDTEYIPVNSMGKVALFPSTTSMCTVLYIIMTFSPQESVSDACFNSLRSTGPPIGHGICYVEF